MSKREAHKVCISQISPGKRDNQQCEVRISSQIYETHVSMLKREAHEVRISQMSPGKCDNQKREVRASSQQKCETRVSKPKRESHIYYAECELHISEPCVTET